MIIEYKREDIINSLESVGYSLLSDGQCFDNMAIISIQDKDGYKYTCRLDHALNGKKKPLVGSRNNFSLHNINQYLELQNVHFRCVSQEYVSASSDLEFACTKCEEHVFNSWNNVHRNDGTNRQHVICPNCDGRTESIHALVLKQLFEHEHPDTVTEERSCRNPATGKILPTDIVNHSLKIAIEIQSQWHDFKDKQQIDAYKKKFWIDKGYSFFDPDIRDYSVLEMCQLFFDIDELPDYINYEYSNKLNIKKIQKLLDSGLSIPEIESTLRINRHRIYDALYSGKLVYPAEYKNACFKPVVQLDINGKFVREFDSIGEARAFYGFNSGAISNALCHGRHFSNGYYWYLKEDYDPAAAKMNSRFVKFHIPVDKFDKQGNYICSYNTIIEASKDSGVSNTQIYKVLTGELKQTGGYIYKKAA